MSDELSLTLQKSKQIGHYKAATAYVDEVIGVGIGQCCRVGLVDSGVGMPLQTVGCGQVLHVFCPHSPLHAGLGEVVDSIGWQQSEHSAYVFVVYHAEHYSHLPALLTG